ncbi:G-alpha-domain-containing protein [Russula emetica]|nr:G-alpha-domain-containing protein [Russula emetica]
MPTSISHNTPSIDLEEINTLWPPIADFSNETPSQRDERLQLEREAKRINDEIDAQIEIEKSERRKRRPDIRIILLGQAESGKSTILRNFQLQFAPTAFHAEAAAWRAVIDLNLVRSVTFLLNLLEESTRIMPLRRLTDDLRRLRVSLSACLARFISPEHYPATCRLRAPRLALPTERAFEVSVRSGSRWKTLFKDLLVVQEYEEVQNARRVIEACREDIVTLWNHPAVRASLADQSISLEFQSGFFLDAVDRIAAPGYEPSPADILKARIQTLGVEEHPLRVETGTAGGSLAWEVGQLWSIIDVGGSRALRAAWLPYFDDVNMLLFIAPVSAFNQTLTEDRSVNRLWDSFLLWKSLCVHKLLKKAAFVLLLNKYDLLDVKLQSGIKFRDYVTSYKDRPNNTETVLQYLKGKFTAIHQQDPQNKMILHIHVTCATDSSSTSIVLTRIREVICRDNFRKANLL